MPASGRGREAGRPGTALPAPPPGGSPAKGRLFRTETRCGLMGSVPRSCRWNLHITPAGGLILQTGKLRLREQNTLPKV